MVPDEPNVNSGVKYEGLISTSGLLLLYYHAFWRYSWMVDYKLLTANECPLHCFNCMGILSFCNGSMIEFRSCIGTVTVIMIDT